MPISRPYRLLAALACAGCSLMVGEDLSGGERAGEAASGTDGGADPATGADGSSGTTQSPGTPGTSLPADGRFITFEDGALVHASTGVDQIVGPALLAAGASALAGKYSLGVDSPDSYAVVSFPPTADLYLSFHVRLNRMTNGRLLRLVVDRADAEIEVEIDGDELVGWFNAAGLEATFGRTAIASGSTMRVGVRYHAGTTEGEIELFRSTDGGRLEPTGGRTSATSLRATISGLRIGATDTTTVDGAFDDIRISTTSFGD